MDGRGCRHAHLEFRLHDGRSVFAGPTMDGWWVSVYRDGKSEGGGRGLTFQDALHDSPLRDPGALLAELRPPA